jgi:hypothetical protein
MFHFGVESMKSICYEGRNEKVLTAVTFVWTVWGRPRETSGRIVSTWTETEDRWNFPYANRDLQCRPTVPCIPVFS